MDWFQHLKKKGPGIISCTTIRSSKDQTADGLRLSIPEKLDSLVLY